MTDFESKDRWGYPILFPQSTWDHAINRGHFSKEKGMWQSVMSAFELSPLVIDDERLEGSRMDGPERVGDLRYVSYCPALDGYLIVPAIVAATPVVRIGHPTMEAGTRIAWTAYVAPKIPSDGKVMFKWPPEKS